MLSLRPSLLAVVWAGVLVLASMPAPAASAAASRASCGGPFTLALDRSGSMAAHDPHGELRLAVGDGLDAARPATAGDRVVPFAAMPAAAIPADAGWSDAIGRGLTGGDEGATDLDGLLADATLLGGGGLVLVTDGEAELSSAPDALRALITIGGEPGVRTAAVARAGGAAVLTIRSAAEAKRVLGAWCSPMAPMSASAEAVLISGLGTTARGVDGAHSAEGCADAGAMRGWCGALVARGWRVSVVAASVRRRGSAVIDSTGRLDENAAALRDWLARRRAAGRAVPVLVGHSMGGLIAHAALRRGAAALGLVTVGTPHAGSYGADAYAAARVAAAGCMLTCPIAAAALTSGAVSVRRRFGPALDDLTRLRRTVQAPLGATGVPTAAWAGVPNASPSLPVGVPVPNNQGEYVAPNDGIVGRGSATGRLAGLAPDLVMADGGARHSDAVPPKGVDTELGSAEVARWVADAAGRLAARGRVRGLAARRTSTSGAQRPLRPRRVTVSLQSMARLEPGSSPVATVHDAVVVATAPIGVTCDGTPVAPVGAARGLWFLDVGAMGCARVGGGAAALSQVAPVVLGTAVAGAADPRAELVVARERRGWRAVVRLQRTLSRPELVRRGRRIPLRRAPADEWGAHRWVARLPAHGGARLLARVRIAGRSDLVGEVVLP